MYQGSGQGKLAQFSNDESGAVAIEYSFIAAALLLAIFPAFGLITSALGGKFAVVVDAFNFFK